MQSYPSVMKTREVCELLKVSRFTLYKLVEKKAITPIHVGGLKSWRFAESAVMKLINGDSKQ
jgi:excisionase family DNA binding protein